MLMVGQHLNDATLDHPSRLMNPKPCSPSPLQIGEGGTDFLHPHARKRAPSRAPDEPADFLRRGEDHIKSVAVGSGRQNDRRSGARPEIARIDFEAESAFQE